MTLHLQGNSSQGHLSRESLAVTAGVGVTLPSYGGQA